MEQPPPHMWENRTGAPNTGDNAVHSSGYLKEMIRQYPGYYQTLGFSSPHLSCEAKSFEEDTGFVASQLRDARQTLEAGPHDTLNTPPIPSDDSNLAQVTIASISKVNSQVITTLPSSVDLGNFSGASSLPVKMRVKQEKGTD